eukprot:Colp12_sorted_trinity150504_noHs@34111
MDTLKNKTLPFISGTVMTVNFVIFWAIPIMGMGQLYKALLKPFLNPLYVKMEQSKILRSFAATYLYTKPEHADFFAMSLLATLNCSITIPFMFYWQFKYGSLPYWLIYAYYCSWVGIGGSMMGAAYGLAHKEGHYFGLYKKHIRDSFVGHFFENWLGIFFGNVPWNFTTSHNLIHHRLDGGMGDTFYEWDLDRSSYSDFMLYVHRILMHMVGYSSLKFFYAHGMKSKAEQLETGVKFYLGATVAILAVTRSPMFVFWMIVQPMMCMNYFLALINIGFHGFIEYDADGKHIEMVNSTAIIDGEDDLFGEDDHMAHHYNTTVYFKDLKAHQQSKIEQFKKVKASVFRNTSIVELSIFIVLGLWDKLADHYVDFTGEMTREEIKTMLQVRSRRIETPYAVYQKFLENPTPERRKELAAIAQAKFAQEYAAEHGTPLRTEEVPAAPASAESPPLAKRAAGEEEED